MDLDDFKAFLAIYKHGSISKAASSLYMNQSNLSSKIQNRLIYNRVVDKWLIYA